MNNKKGRRLSGSSSGSSSTFAATVKQAFSITQSPLPWEKAICAAIASGCPVLAGLLLGHLQYGLTAGIGSFTYLYTFNVPYAHRAKKLFFTFLAMSLAVGLGTLLSPFPLAAAAAVGLIGAAAVFVFGAFQIAGPSAIFFVLGFLMSSGMPEAPQLAPLRAGLVFLGGAFSWMLAMTGWFVRPHGPETAAVRRVYTILADLMDSAGTERFNEARQRLLSTLNAAGNTLSAGHLSWYIPHRFKRLVRLNDQAHTIFLYILERGEQRTDKLPQSLGAYARSIAASLERNDDRAVGAIRPLKPEDEDAQRLFELLTSTEAILTKPSSKLDPDIFLSKPSARTLLGGAFDKNSIVFLTAIRYGVVLAAAAVIAGSLHFRHAYWVPLSCAAVMSGSTIVATFHRAIQRSIGTIAGVVIATLILSVKPEGMIIVIALMIFTALTEFAIVFNYGIAALFITSNSLLMAESTSSLYDFAYFATARIVDVVIGAAIGLVGVLLIGSRQASNLLPHLIAKTIRSEQQLLFALFSGERATWPADARSIERSKMRTNITNLKIVYTTALGEIPSDARSLELLWPAMFAIEQLGYLLESGLKQMDRPVLEDKNLAQLLLVFESMAGAAEQKRPPSAKPVPEIEGFANITKELSDLQHALQKGWVT
ncbi:Inner membrane protein YccS [Paenibacillus konkukensis]|uniref:Inner membrane protein YccS n=1 Tax=Paenibacillus konkukensis TaxID=2020716 RepID=A0ABY4RQB3_9BACL|nr:FUSC family protein [Paenibacillus konkukensis]UQZ84657.1 Inner membrane protein YccS [Paenibacillus konkukensis]